MKHDCKNLENFICPAPFKDFMIFEHSTNVCCPEWFDLDYMVEKYPEKFKDRGRPFPSYATDIEDVNDLMQNWNNDFHNDLRESIKDGSYSFCTKMCPYINKAYASSKQEFEEDLFFKRYTRENIHKEVDIDNPVPQTVYFNFDTACNLKCPSCRLELIHNGKSIKAKATMEAVETQFAGGIKKVVCTGSGDPFYSNVFRNWLKKFNPQRYPALEDIFLVSNGNMFTPKTWDSLTKVKPFLKGMEWSVDAGTKTTYETKTRLNGKWDKLMENMDFLASLDHFKELTFSFVVQKDNYKECVKFANLINEKFANSTANYIILFRHLQDWGHQSKAWIKEKNVCSPDHPLHSELVEELKVLHTLPNVLSNVQHLIKNTLV